MSKQTTSVIQHEIPTNFKPKYQEDIRIINMILQGDTQKFSLLYYKYQPVIHRSILPNVKYNSDKANNIVADIFVKVYNNIHKYKPNYTFSAWLSTISRNTLIDHFRKEKQISSKTSYLNDIVNNNKKEYHYEGEKVTFFDPKDESQITPDKTLIKSELEKYVKETVKSTLKRTEKYILRGFYFKGKTQEQISSETGLCVNTIKVILFRSREKLNQVFIPSVREMYLVA